MGGDTISGINKKKKNTHELGGLTEAFRDYMRADVLFYVPFYLLQKLCRDKYDARCAVANFCVLSTGDIHERPGGRVNDVQKLEDGGSIVGNLGFSSIVDDELVHSPGPQCARKRL